MLDYFNAVADNFLENLDKLEEILNSIYNGKTN
jgi:hypothetical protein